jgi:outer membrane protein
MKKVLLLGAVALFSAVSAQMEQGSWIISGKTGIEFNAVNTKYEAEGMSFDGAKVNTFNITPSVGYFAVDNLAIGVDLGYTSTKTTFNNDQLGINFEDETSLFSVMPNATYYFIPGSVVRPYLGAGIGYGSLTSADFFNEGNTTKGGLLWGAKGGMVYLLNNRIGIDFGVGYNSFTTKETVEGTEINTVANGFGVNAGFSLFLGSNKVQKEKK